MTLKRVGTQRLAWTGASDVSILGDLYANFVCAGFWGDVVSGWFTYSHVVCVKPVNQLLHTDYQAYAAAYPQQLAKAIEKGIPKSLRGMIWQLM